MHVWVGELVSPGQPVVEIVNAGTLQITTYVSASAASTLTVGDSVMLADGTTGVVAAVASAIGQQSGKVEVKVRITDLRANHIVGEFVSLDIFTSGNVKGELTVPLTAVKNDAQGAYLLVINEDETAERVNVETGSIRGESVVITSGLEGVTHIVRDARQVTVGSAVSVK
jgi:multidrug efflux system membrane fusion protein